MNPLVKRTLQQTHREYLMLARIVGSNPNRFSFSSRTDWILLGIILYQTNCTLNLENFRIPFQQIQSLEWAFVR
jgi:hypothetical protein